ncbi:MAG: hypothetical protein OXH04_12760 [Acidobacteria bacterium]|nr:hypothetical protein [Acidobacteriota bacterium]
MTPTLALVAAVDRGDPWSQAFDKIMAGLDDAFWRGRTVDEIAAQQGVSVPQPLDDMIGAAANLWNDDEDFNRFLQGIRDRRTIVGQNKRTGDPGGAARLLR